MSDLFKKQRTFLTFFNRRLDEFIEPEQEPKPPERLVRNIIEELEEEWGTAKYGEILDIAEQEGLSREETEKIIDKLLKDGTIYEPRMGKFKLT